MEFGILSAQVSNPPWPRNRRLRLLPLRRPLRDGPRRRLEGVPKRDPNILPESLRPGIRSSVGVPVADRRQGSTLRI